MSDLPPLADFLPGYEASSWSGLTAPKSTPPEIVERLNREVNAGLADPRMIARFIDLGGPPTPATPVEFGRTIVEDTEKWAKVIKSSGASTN